MKRKFLPVDSRLLTHRAALANMMRRVALQAGEIILDHREAGIDTAHKDDGSPVTPADRAAEAFITKEIGHITPGIPVIGEEAAADGAAPDISAAIYVWFVDALDGTKEFIGGGDDFTVNIALVKNGEPVLGIVYAPAHGALYAGFIEEDGRGQAVRWMADTGKDKPIHVRPVPRSGVTVAGSKSHGDEARLAEFLADLKVEKMLRRGSSLKLCLVASGKADLYPRFGPTCAWDIAAGHAVLRAAGGEVSTFAGAPLRYGRAADGGFENPAFLGRGADMPKIA